MMDVIDDPFSLHMVVVKNSPKPAMSSLIDTGG